MRLKKDVENMEKGEVGFSRNRSCFLTLRRLLSQTTSLSPRRRGAPEGPAGADRLQEEAGAGVPRSEGHLAVPRLP